ncbi:stromelysin-1-like [Scyliorhinus canicula]|uniref:stromelysin-1-like n=1 Tax=Scyliorhinus canicula TaxID=7830 RepID=UPI0018F486A2|nr:stromelysin-1-like [Scyliorhinus canicula]
MKTMCFYLTVVLKLGFLAFSSSALPLPTVKERGGPKVTQKAYNLQVAGSLVNGSMDKAQLPRCGVTDTEEFSFFPGQPKFRKMALTFRLLNRTPDISNNAVDDIIRKAFKVWADVTPLSFTQTVGLSDIEMKFVTGEHGDGSPFDGPGRILAHAFAPGPGIRGDVHFDEAERWTTNSQNFNLFSVAAHEIGHSLGLGHSNDKNALMYRFYKFQEINGFQLPADDVNGIQALYGAPVVPPSPNPTPAPGPNPPGPNPTPAPGPNPTQQPPPCDPTLFADAIIATNRNILLFKNGFFKSLRTSQVIPVRNIWQNIMSNIDAAFQDRRRIIFFTGSQFWIFRRNNLVQGFPKPITDIGFPNSVTKIDAALRIRRRIFFFVGNQLWIYHRRRNELSGPSPISSTFSGISKVDAAFQYRRRNYLISGPNVFIYSSTRLLHHWTPRSWNNCT